MGFYPIKINVVAIKGVNDDEIVDFADMVFRKPYHIRFIEMNLNAPPPRGKVKHSCKR